MGYMQRIRITKDSDLDDNTTWRYKLPSVGKYTAFEMRINCNRYATRTLNTVVYPLEACISKIELLAGGARALFSLTGQQVDAMNYWDFGRPNPRRYRQEAATGNDLILFLTGGRGLYDRQYGWDMARMGETYLEYTYDLNEGDADYFAANDHDVSLYGYRWMGPNEPNFSGYLRSRQLAAWTTSASDALKTIAIPVGNPVRRIGVQAKTRASTIGGTFSELEVRCNEGEFSPVIVKSCMDWVMAEVAEYGLENLAGGIDYLVASTVMDLPYWWSYMETVQAQRYGASGQPVINLHGITIPIRVQATSAVAGEVTFNTRGWGFQKCLRIGFDHDPDGVDLLDTRGLGSLDLLATEAAGSKAAAVFVQDVINY